MTLSFNEFYAEYDLYMSYTKTLSLTMTMLIYVLLQIILQVLNLCTLSFVHIQNMSHSLRNLCQGHSWTIVKFTQNYEVYAAPSGPRAKPS